MFSREKTMQKILVVDDEKKIVEIIKAYLERDGYEIMVAYDGKTALELVKKSSPDLVILDLMLPEVSGWDVCRTIRKESDVPVIMVTAREDVTDKIIGLELGADDYITKPFEPKELVSRVRAVLRRYQGKSNVAEMITVGDLTINPAKREVLRGETPINLTASEFSLLVALAENPGNVLTRAQLLDRVQGEAYEGYERTMDSHIKNLRKKIEPDPEHPVFIVTVRGVGYKLEEHRSAQD